MSDEIDCQLDDKQLEGDILGMKENDLVVRVYQLH